MKENQKILNANQLKLIAFITMLIDHIGYVWLEYGIFNTQMLSYEKWFDIYAAMRDIGRIAFPIFAFFVVEGYRKTNNVKKYALRLLIFAIISEVPFSLITGGVILNTDCRNVFWTLLFGLISLSVFDNKKINGIFKYLILVICFVVPEIFNADYGFYGVLTIFILHKFYDKKLISFILGYIVLLIFTLAESAAIFGFALLYLYNNKRIKSNKYIGYAFYPIHLLVLFLSRSYVLNILSCI